MQENSFQPAAGREAVPAGAAAREQPQPPSQRRQDPLWVRYLGGSAITLTIGLQPFVYEPEVWTKLPEYFRRKGGAKGFVNALADLEKQLGVTTISPNAVTNATARLNRITGSSTWEFEKFRFDVIRADCDPGAAQDQQQPPVQTSNPGQTTIGTRPGLSEADEVVAPREELVEEVELVLLCSAADYAELKLPAAHKATHIEVDGGLPLSLIANELFARAREAEAELGYQNFFDAVDLASLVADVKKSLEDGKQEVIKFEKTRKALEESKVPAEYFKGALGGAIETMCQNAKGLASRVLRDSLLRHNDLSRRLAPPEGDSSGIECARILWDTRSTISLSEQRLQMWLVQDPACSAATRMIAVACQSEADEPPSQRAIAVDARWPLGHGVKPVLVNLTVFDVPAIVNLPDSLKGEFADLYRAHPNPLTVQEISSCTICALEFSELSEPRECWIQLVGAMDAAAVQQRLDAAKPHKDATLVGVQLEVKGKATEQKLQSKQIAPQPSPEIRRSGIYPKQQEVGDRIFDRAKVVLGEAWPKFESVEFLVLTANFTTLRDQTLSRLVDEGALTGQDEASNEKVVFIYKESASNVEAYSKFRARALDPHHSNRLFVIVADECHYGITLNGASDCFVNDFCNNRERKYKGELLARANVLVLLVSATPFNVLAQPSYIDSKHNVISWFKEGDRAGAYKRLEAYFATIRVTAAEEELESLRADHGFDQLCPANVKGDERDYFLLADYLFSFAFFSTYRWDVANGRLRASSEPPEATEKDALAEEWLKKFESLTGLDRASKLASAIPRRALSRLPQIGQKLLRKTLQLEQGTDRDKISKLAGLAEAKLQEESASTQRTTKSFSETDRIVADLLGAAGGVDISADVGERQNGDAIVPERVLQGRMKMIRVSKNETGEDMGRVLKLARDHLFSAKLFSVPNQRRAFAVLCDFGTQSLDKTLEFEDVPLRDENECGYFTIGERKRKCKRAIYQHLHSLPCLLLLCDKGRMGDTFPPSFDCLDLRIRTSDNLQTFIQELGRMSRYPIAHSREIRRDRAHEDLQAHHELAVVAEDGECLGYASTVGRYDELVRGREQFTVKRVLHRAPYALLLGKRMQKLRTAVSEQQRVNSERPADQQCEIQRCIRFPSADLYIKGSGKGIAADQLWEFANCRAGGTGNAKSYNLRQEPLLVETHPRRLLLWAETQIGKTGAFTHFLLRLKKELSQAEPPMPLVLLRDKSRSWHFPYWKDLYDQHATKLDYSQPKIGKYHAAVLRQRLELLVDIAQAETPHDWIEEYCRRLQGAGQFGELLLSAAARQCLDKLQNDLRGTECPLGRGGHEKNAAAIRTLQLALNWDRRMDEEKVPKIREESLLSVLHELVAERGAASDAALRRGVQARWELNELADDEEMDARAPRRLPPHEVQPRSDDSYRATRYTSSIDLGSLPEAENVAEQLRYSTQRVTYKLSVPEEAQTVLTPTSGTYRASNDDNLMWIFTCSYKRHSEATQSAFLDRNLAMRPAKAWSDYVQVLIVRSEELKPYSRTCGKDYIIVGLPDELVVEYEKDVPTQLCAEQHGIGYARLFAQLLADKWGLNRIWMLDDNVIWTYFVQVAPCGGARERPIQAQKCSFFTPMRGVELLHRQQDEMVVEREPDEHLPESIEFDARRYGKEVRPLNIVQLEKFLDIAAGNLPPEGRTDRLDEFAGRLPSYAVIGIHRDVARGASEMIKRPFTRTHSIYSFFLLNVQATVAARVLYPAKPFWEDIEFLHLANEANLVVCKCNKYLHRKHQISPPRVPSLSPLQEALLAGGGFHLCTEVGGVDQPENPHYKLRQGTAIPIDMNWRWLYSGTDDDSRSELLRWIYDHDDSKASTVLVVYESPDAFFKLTMEGQYGLFDRFTLPYLQSHSYGGIDTVSLLVKVQQQPGEPGSSSGSSGTQENPLGSVPALNAAWVESRGGAVSTNLTHQGELFWLARLPLPEVEAQQTGIKQERAEACNGSTAAVNKKQRVEPPVGDDVMDLD